MVAVGPGRRNRDGEVVPVDLKEGDRVLLPDYGGQTIKMGGDEEE